MPSINLDILTNVNAERNNTNVYTDLTLDLAIGSTANNQLYKEQQILDIQADTNLGAIYNSISNIITTKLKSLDVTQRPVHCADKKREVIYIKDQDKWEKEDDEKKKIRRAITKIANKNYVLIPQFREKYPDYIKSSSPVSDQYNKIVIEAMGGTGDNDLEKQNKIIRNIAKVITIDKDEKSGLVN